MASIPLAGDRLIAKVRLTFYLDSECSIEFPPVPPGFGYKDSFQVPERQSGEEVGTYTGQSSQYGYEVEWVQQYRKVPTWPSKPFNVIIQRKSWVKKGQVTGYWDKGIDSPLNDPTNPINTPPPPPPKDNTNTFLLLAVGAGLFFKFVAPKLKGNGKN
jgi:hypothetical protein